MAAAAAGAGAGAAQEKQFPPALLSFFIYNPRFGPREGEVRGAGPRAGVSRRSEEGPRAGAARRPATGPESWGASGRGHRAAPVTPLLGRHLRGFVPGLRPGQGISGGPDNAGRVSLGSGIEASVLNEGSAG